MEQTPGAAGVMNQSPENITYSQTGAEGLDKVEELWAKLRQHHKERAPEVFKEHFGKMTWETRKTGLLKKAQKGAILVDIAKDKNKLVGYCISTISSKKDAELESIYIEKDYRKHHIGDRFMKTALAWMDAHGAARKIIGVAAGNEEALGFYQKYGFYTRIHVLQQADSK
jgi:ribosomal protein S18 acetylase RimI-like enzyme